MISITIPAKKPNKKYTGGVRLCPDVLTLIDSTGQPIDAADDEMIDSFVVGQECVVGRECIIGQECVPES